MIYGIDDTERLLCTLCVTKQEVSLHYKQETAGAKERRSETRSDVEEEEDHDDDTPSSSYASSFPGSPPLVYGKDAFLAGLAWKGVMAGIAAAPTTR